MGLQPCNSKHVLPRKLNGPLYAFRVGVARIGPNLGPSEWAEPQPDLDI